VNQLVAAQDDVGAGYRFEAEHGANAALDPPVILLDAVVNLLAVSDRNRLLVVGGCRQFQPGLHIAFQDRGPVSLGTIDGDLGWSSVARQGLTDKAFGRCKVSALAEMELNCGARLVDGTVEIEPLSTNLDLSLIDMPLY